MSDKAYIWRYLWEQIGNEYGVAGLMGNLQAESGLNPENLQNSYEKKLGMNDREYTEAVDDLRYQKDQFVQDGAGYGLAQWTYWSRKRDLYEYAEESGKSIGDLQMQLDFLIAELARYKAVFKVLLNAASVREASDAVLLKYERPADQSEQNQERRAALGQKFYDEFAKGIEPPERDDAVKSEVVLNEKARAVVDLARTKIGDPYVFGTWGQPCTPEIRKRYAGYNPQYKDKIYGECPVLSHKQSGCAGCKWDGHLCYDCRGFVHYCLKNGAGIDLYGEGCTTQWEHRANWALKGKTVDLPNLVCVLYKRNGQKMSHTGIHIGNGNIIHCTGNGGVKTGKVTDSGWTHFAIPAGLYTADEIKSAGDVVIMDTIKQGSSGAAVKYLQESLNKLGFVCGNADGQFGSKTKLAVMAFQSAYDLKSDGIVGPQTWDALETALDQLEGIQPEKPQEQEKPDAPVDSVRITLHLPADALRQALETGDLIIDCRSGNIANIDYQ